MILLLTVIVLMAILHLYLGYILFGTAVIEWLNYGRHEYSELQKLKEHQGKINEKSSDRH